MGVNRISQNLEVKITEAREGRIVLSDNSEIAAKYLKTKEDLSAFYGATDGEQATTPMAAGVGYMAAVALAAMIVAGAGGPGPSGNDLLSNLDLDLSGCSIEELLNTRSRLLTQKAAMVAYS